MYTCRVSGFADLCLTSRCLNYYFKLILQVDILTRESKVDEHVMLTAFHWRHVFEVILATNEHGCSDYRRKAHHASDVTTETLAVEHARFVVGLLVHCPRSWRRAEIHDQPEQLWTEIKMCIVFFFTVKTSFNYS